ncbi:Fop carboxy-terminal duplication domain protein [Toxoplasma gondii RUB]|uniref:Fop carboxy-terminal duplication domain protein n=7 Tax=Toxoplasma gondii TaxID=5811 RepID=B9QHN7_TOXGV|nr:Fop carboxy-terminal duplication domain protein [Toxoplasma gondii VEG]KFG29964.1 Fop carboxy-terminal duplication domain protein [Toxoplasma gondii p89]KFG41934.1 Fop carboxy-terminal duplication domain protein [Toxoplasma gondii GAB2-2007-GAL-DOM2]KFG61282.1 Fop carboxy-terminal duplication domain protein [Toxoplasma gondii RUB]KFH00940.1 Fop carboxy-terminal duplication domain protein [Toxoplasma gondii VAND]
MVRGAYSRGGTSRYNSNTASRGTGVRSWARARVYGMKNNSRLPAGRGRGGPSSNLAISRGRYTNYRGASSYGRGRGGYTNNRGSSMAAYRNNMPRNGVQSYRERLSQRGGRGARGGAFASRRGGLRGGRGGARGGFRGGRGGRGARGGRGGRGGAPVNKESLDAELDKYMGDDNIKKRLDNDLENYFSRSGGVGGAPAPGSGAAGPAGDDASRVAAGVVANGTAADAGVASTGVAPRGGMDVSMDNSL